MPEERKFRNAVPAGVLLRKNLQNGVPERFVTTIHLRRSYTSCSPWHLHGEERVSFTFVLLQWNLSKTEDG
jgi:hypothetical protein